MKKVLMGLVVPCSALLLGVVLAACGRVPGSISDKGANNTPAEPAIVTGAVPPDFLWGVASSGFQSEGGNFDSNWQRRVDAGDVDPYFNSVDFRHRYVDDIELARKMGVNAYRFGLNWARIEPREGEYDEVELAYYDDVIHRIRAAGMTPIPTLHHYVYPGWVADQGGWNNAKTVEDFVRYGTMIAQRWHDQTRWWLIFNEPLCDIVIGVTAGYIDPQNTVTVTARFVEAHGRVYDAIHAVVPDAMVSSNECSTNFPGPLAVGLDALLLDRMYREHKLDFIGTDVYYRPNSTNGLEFLTTSNGRPWEVRQEPHGMYEQITGYHQRYPDIPIVVTENGMPTDNGLPRPDGLSRADHLRDNIYWMQQAMQEGVPVLGYLYWSLTDNYEWGSYQPRFGLYTVDAVTDPTLTRKPTDGVDAYRCVISNNGVPADYQPVRSATDGSANGNTNPPACPE